jgi:predicted alpha-1,6-mannanase (GH76 family)
MSVLESQLQSAVRVLQRWYRADSFAKDTGLYHWDDPNLASDIGGGGVFFATISGTTDDAQDTLRWWNSANAITALIDYMLVTGDQSYVDAVAYTFSNVTKAYKPDVANDAAGALGGAIVAGALLGAIAGPLGAVVGGLIGAFVGGDLAAHSDLGREVYSNFLNGYYDDEGWWASAWIKAYDLTGERQYLDEATVIWTDMMSGWDTGYANGGIWWGKDHKNLSGDSPYKNAIANELFLSISTALYIRTKQQTYLDWAMKEWNWFRSMWFTGDPVSYLINDSLIIGAAEVDRGQPVWTYNHGPILSGLVDLYMITGQRSYLQTAESIADALIDNWVVSSAPMGDPTESGTIDGVLMEFDDGAPTNIDHRQFKGIFVRHLAYLDSKSRKGKYRAFLLRNARTALANTSSDGEVTFGASWRTAFDMSDFIRQTSGVDLLNAALLARRQVGMLPALDLLLLDSIEKATD